MDNEKDDDLIRELNRLARDHTTKITAMIAVTAQALTVELLRQGYNEDQRKHIHSVIVAEVIDWLEELHSLLWPEQD